jgi:hypothetical protein
LLARRPLNLGMEAANNGAKEGKISDHSYYLSSHIFLFVSESVILAQSSNYDLKFVTMIALHGWNK